MDGRCTGEFEHASFVIISIAGVGYGYWSLRIGGGGVRGMFRPIYCEQPDSGSRLCSTLTDVITGCESKGKAIFRESCRTGHLIRVAGCFSIWKPANAWCITNACRLLLRNCLFVLLFTHSNPPLSRSQWPRGLRRRSTAARLLRLWVQIPPGAWMLVCC